MHPAETDYFAVIDLGTNTFHLLIVDAKNKVIRRERRFVNLAEDGIGWIGDAAYQRGLNAMQDFLEILRSFPRVRFKAVGTAALRNAGNAMDFIGDVSGRTGLTVDVIDGLQEARYIYSGIRAALRGLLRHTLMIDIGGGSVELIMAGDDRILFSGSYPLGVSILYHRFHHTEPIQPHEVQHVRTHLHKTLAELPAFLKEYDQQFTLVGASGTFEVLDAVFSKQLDQKTYSEISRTDFDRFYNRILPMTLDERLQHGEIPDSRAQYFIVALILIDYMLDLLDSTHFFAVSYAMKEGILIDMRGDIRNAHHP